MGSEILDLLLDSVDRMMEERCGQAVVDAAERAWPGELWDLLESAGLPLACVPEAAGGGGASLAEMLAVVRRAAESAAPVPLGETAITGLLLAEAGLEVPAGPLASAWDDGVMLSADGALTGVAHRVPWGRIAARLAVLAGGPEGPVVAVVDPGDAQIADGRNIAFEPRDDMRLDGVRPLAVGELPAGAPDAAELSLRAALLRAVQLAGALDATLELSLRYAGERVQFGRPIARFPAVQGLLTEIAAERAAAAAVVEVAVECAVRDGFAAARGQVAAAKIRAGQAAGVAAEHAHQIHGAIGFTDEHRLHHITRRLWAWRDEYGPEALWSQALGRQALDEPDLWEFVTALA